MVVGSFVIDPNASRFIVPFLSYFLFWRIRKNETVDLLDRVQIFFMNKMIVIEYFYKIYKKLSIIYLV